MNNIFTSGTNVKENKRKGIKVAHSYTNIEMSHLLRSKIFNTFLKSNATEIKGKTIQNAKEYSEISEQMKEKIVRIPFCTTNY